MSDGSNSLSENLADRHQFGWTGHDDVAGFAAVRTSSIMVSDFRHEPSKMIHPKALTLAQASPSFHRFAATHLL